MTAGWVCREKTRSRPWRAGLLAVRPWRARAFLHLTSLYVHGVCVACGVRRVKCQEEARLHVGSVRRPRTRLLLRLQQRALTRDRRER